MDKNLIRNIVIIVVIIIGVGFLYWKFDYSKNATKITELKQEYDKLNTQVNEARKVAARMQEYIEKLKILEKQLEIANKMLPDSQNFETIIDSVTILANRNNIKIKEIKPNPPSSGADYSTLSFQISVLGSYHTLALFFNSLGNQERIYKVYDISLNPSKGNEGDYNLSANFILSTYYKGTGVANNTQGGKNAKKKK